MTADMPTCEGDRLVTAILILIAVVCGLTTRIFSVLFLRFIIGIEVFFRVEFFVLIIGTLAGLTTKFVDLLVKITDNRVFFCHIP